MSCQIIRAFTKRRAIWSEPITRTNFRPEIVACVVTQRVVSGPAVLCTVVSVPVLVTYYSTSQIIACVMALRVVTWYASARAVWKQEVVVAVYANFHINVSLTRRALWCHAFCFIARRCGVLFGRVIDVQMYVVHEVIGTFENIIVMIPDFNRQSKALETKINRL